MEKIIIFMYANMKDPEKGNFDHAGETAAEADPASRRTRRARASRGATSDAN